ncbi:MAG: hypothetical protein P1P76_05880 [Anaerolineales bacterium]|nr:hypothetical protein [Anaerolineales bacterium]
MEAYPTPTCIPRLTADAIWINSGTPGDPQTRRGQVPLRVDIPHLYADTELFDVERRTLPMQINNDHGLVSCSYSYESCASIQASPQSSTEV